MNRSSVSPSWVQHLMAMSLAVAGILLLLSALLGACESGTNEPVRSADAAYPDLTYSERIVIGGANALGPAAFGSVAGVALHNDSMLAVADGSSQEIHVFDLDGGHLRSLAGDGVGPGMAKAIRRISYAPDGGICVWDRQLGRITRFGVDGSVLETWGPEYAGFSIMESTLVGLTDSCSSAVFGDRIRSDVAREVGTKALGMVQLVDTIVYMLIKQRHPARELTRRASPPIWLMRSERLNSVHELILGERLEAALVGSVVWLGTTDSLRWSRMDVGGSELSPVRLPTTRMPASAQDIDRMRDRRKEEAPRLESFLGASQAQQYKDAYYEGVEKVPASAFLPAYDAMIVGSDGTLWIRKAGPDSARAADWLLLDADGIAVGRLSLPRAGEPVAGSANLLVMRHRDALDAEYLRVLDIMPPTGQPFGERRAKGPAGSLPDGHDDR